MNEINKVVSKSKKLEFWEHVYHAEKEIRGLAIELENRIREEGESSGFVFQGIKILNIMTEIKNQLKDLKEVIKLGVYRYE